MSETPSKPADKEMLLSLVVISDGNARADIAAMKQLSEFAVGSYDFYELVLLACSPGGAWLETVRKSLVSTGNIRVIILEERLAYDDAVSHALQLTIGDIVVCGEPKGVSSELIEKLVQKTLEGQFEIVKTVAAKPRVASVTRAFLKVIEVGLFAFVGRRIEVDVLRSFAVTRAAATRIHESNDALRYFRLIDLGDQFAEYHLAVDDAHGRGRLDGLLRKSQISAFLVSSAASRILSGIVVLSFFLSLLSLSYMVYALVIWLVLDQVSEGWTSLSLVLSVLFAANFGVLSAVCLGVLELLRTNRPKRPPGTVQEITNADLFTHSKNLNVEIASHG